MVALHFAGDASGDVYFDNDDNNVDLGWVRMKKAGDGDDQNHPGWAVGQWVAVGFRGLWGIENTVGMRTHSHDDG